MTKGLVSKLERISEGPGLASGSRFGTSMDSGSLWRLSGEGF